MQRKNHMENLVLPDFLSRVPTVSYYCPAEHRIRLRYDLAEVANYVLPKDDKKTLTGEIIFTGEGEEFETVYCRQHHSYFKLSDCTVRYPRGIRRPDHVMRGKGISEDLDRAIIKERIVRMLVIGGQTQAEVGARLGIPQQRVSQVASEVANMLKKPDFAEFTSEVDLDDITEPTQDDLEEALTL